MKAEQPYVWLLVVVALSLCVGCTVQERVAPAICEEVCFSHSLRSLSSIDHEQPSGEVLTVIADVCARTSAPCCFKAGGRVACAHGSGG